MHSEQWRTIPGFEDYEASSLGRIRSNKTRRPRVLAVGPDHKGYPCVSLRSPELGERSRPVHTWVMLAFVGPRPEGSVVRHLDGDQLNNTIGNLRYGSQSENELDKVRHGRHHHLNKTHCPAGHPYDEDNTYHWPNRSGRMCRACHRERMRLRALRAANVADRATVPA